MAIGTRRVTRPIASPASSVTHDMDAQARHALPNVREVLAVCAHPDDESFGLGAILAAFAEQGATTRVLCFTHGEASTLGVTSRPLAEMRADELRTAADALGVGGVQLLTHRDGHLEDVGLDQLAGIVVDSLGDADLLLVFDEGGITGHPDHCRATDAALAVAEQHHVPVLAWALPEEVAAALNAEFGTAFVGRPESDISIVIEVDRARQLSAIACHATQSGTNPVLWRRLELLGLNEHLRWLT